MSSSYDSAVIDTAMIEDARLLTLPRGIRLLHLEAIVWSKARLTDGVIPAGMLRRLTDEPDETSAAAQLVDAGLWATTDTGWRIVDFLDSQMSAARVRELREAARQRYDSWKQTNKKRVVNATANGPARPPARPPARVEAEGGSADAPGPVGPGAASKSVAFLDAAEILENPGSSEVMRRAALKQLQAIGFHSFEEARAWFDGDNQDPPPDTLEDRYLRSIEGGAA